MNLTNLKNRMKAAVLGGLTLISGSLYQSCGDLGAGSYLDGGYYDGGYGPIDSGVFQNSVDNFDSYIRGTYEGGEWDPAIYGE